MGVLSASVKTLRMRLQMRRARFSQRRPSTRQMHTLQQNNRHVESVRHVGAQGLACQVCPLRCN